MTGKQSLLFDKDVYVRCGSRRRYVWQEKLGRGGEPHSGDGG